MKNKIVICMGSSCFTRGNKRNLAVIENFIKEKNLGQEIELLGSCCEGKCAIGPNIEINGKLYNTVEAEALLEILEETFGKKD